MSAETAADQMLVLSGDRVKWVEGIIDCTLRDNEVLDSFRLREQLKMRLHSSGWVDEVRLMCRKVITKEQGDISVDQIVEEVTPMARKAVPDTLKKFLLSQIQNILMENYSEE